MNARSGVAFRENCTKVAIRYVGILLAVGIFGRGQFVFAEKVKPCTINKDDYIVMQSSLEYADLSDSYAKSIYDAVRRILRDFLAAHEGCFYYSEKGMELDLASHAQNKLLDLYCEVKRVSSDVLLAVRLEMHGTNENLLSFEASAPFFQPNLVLQYFAVSFPHTFAGQVLPDIPYPYPLSTNRFHLGFEASELYFVGDSISWDFADLENDLIMTEGVPMNVIKSVARYRARKSTRETIAGTVVGIGGLTYVATTVAILILGEGLAGGGDSLRLNSPEQVPTGLWIANIAGLVTMLFGPIGFSIPPPKDLITTLNGWCCTSERD